MKRIRFKKILFVTFIVLIFSILTIGAGASDEANADTSTWWTPNKTYSANELIYNTNTYLGCSNQVGVSYWSDYVGTHDFSGTTYYIWAENVELQVTPNQSGCSYSQWNVNFGIPSNYQLILGQFSPSSTADTTGDAYTYGITVSGPSFSTTQSFTFQDPSVNAHQSLNLGGPDYWNVSFTNTGSSTWVMFFQGLYRTTMNPNVGCYVYYTNYVTLTIEDYSGYVFNPIGFGLGLSFVSICGGFNPTPV